MRNCLVLTDRLVGLQWGVLSGNRRHWVVAIQRQQQSRGFSNEKDLSAKKNNMYSTNFVLGGITHTNVRGILTSSSTIMKDGSGDNNKSGDNNQKNIDNKASTFSTESSRHTPAPPSDNTQSKQARRRPRFGSKKGAISTPKQQKHPQKHPQPLLPPFAKYGTDILNSQFEIPFIQDSSDVAILIPGRPLQGADSNKHGNRHRIKNNDESDFETDSRSKHHKKRHKPLRRRRKLPVVNAAALLDTATYAKISVTPSSAKGKGDQESTTKTRLLRGKKDLLDMLRGHIIGTYQRPFCLAGHGVPKQLLQEHINFADGVLRHYQEPAECTISRPFLWESHSFGKEELENNDDSSSWFMNIRQQDGRSRFKALLPSDNPGGRRRGLSQEWSYQLALYLAVMERMTTQLGKAGSTYRDPTPNKDHHSNSPPTQWKVTLYRGMAFPMEVISSQEDDDSQAGPVPILEWSPHTNTKQQPQVSIRLQGIPTYNGGAGHKRHNRAGTRSKRNAVTLVYTACFPGN